MSQLKARGPQVSVIVVNWNGRHHLAECLPSLLATRYPRFEVTVYDNGSTDGSQTLVRQLFPQVHMVDLGRNLGFTGANNMGMRQAIAVNADYVALLNNDTRVEPEWLSRLVDAAEANMRIAACHSRQLTWDGRQEIRQVFYPEYAAGDNVLAPVSAEDKLFATPYAAGCCMLLRTSTLRQIGLFDSRYFAYAEDLDLCLRAWVAGHEVFCVPDSIIYHRIGGSPTAMRDFWGYRNQITTMLKNYEWSTIWTYRDSVLHRWILTRYRVALRATVSALMMLPGTMQRRRKVQAMRVRSDAEVFELKGMQYGCK